MSTKPHVNSTSVSVIPFNRQSLIYQTINDEHVFAFRHICENMGLDFSSQLKRLKRQPWAVVVMMTTTGKDGKQYRMVGITQPTLFMWLGTIDTSRMKKGKKRQFVVVYQLKMQQVVTDYFSKPLEQALTQANEKLKKQKGIATVGSLALGSGKTFTLREGAATLSARGCPVGSVTLGRWMVRDHICFRQPNSKLWAYAKYFKEGYFTPYWPPTHKKDCVICYTSMRITVKGIKFLVDKYVPKTLEITK